MRRQPLLFSGIFLLALLVPSAMLAQSYALTPGSWRVGGSASVTGFRDVGNDRRFFTIDFSPRIGYFVFKGLSFDANLRFARTSSQGQTSSLWGVGPGLTYYFGQQDWRVYPFASGRTLFTFGEFTDRYAWLGGVGVVILLNAHVGILAELFYQFDDVNRNTGQGNESETYGLRFGVAAFAY